MEVNSAIWTGLRVFYFVAVELSFTAAARRLNVTTGAVSQQIKQLEERLGYTLFHRTTRRLSLTPEGLKLMESVSSAWQTVTEQLQTISADRCRGPVRLIASPSFTLQWLVPRLGDFYRQYPGIELRVDAESEVCAARPASYDLAVDYVLHDHSYQQQGPGQLLMGESVVPVCAPGFLPEPLPDPQKLLDYTLLHDSTPWPGAAPCDEWKSWLAGAGVSDCEEQNQLFFNRSDLAVQAAQQGQGIALGRLSLIANKLDSGELAVACNLRRPSPAGYYLFGGIMPTDQPYSAAMQNNRTGGIEALRQWLLSYCDQS